MRQEKRAYRKAQRELGPVELTTKEMVFFFTTQIN
jgi:hypothetical protein